MFPEDDKEAMRCAFLILLMVVFWLTEALPLPVTSMLPMIALPLLGLMSTKDVAVNYLNSTNYMFFGGLIMAIAVEHCGLHLRVALRIIMSVGTSQARLMLGFMFTTMFISMWISNTATTAMMLPIVDAVADAINQKVEDQPEDPEVKQAAKKEENGVKQLAFDGGEVEKLIPMIDDVEASEINDMPCDLGDTHVYSDDTAPLLFDHKEFESQLAQLTEGKIMSIKQLKTLGTLEEASGHFDDLEALLKGHSPTNTLAKEDIKKNFKRTKTYAKLKTKQEAEKKIRESKSKPSSKKSQPIENNPTTAVELSGNHETKEETERNFLLMAIAFSANIGGTGVVTGTPPNLVVPNVLQKEFGDETGLTFASWMAFAIPVMVVNLLLAWIWIQRLMRWQPACKGCPGSTKEQEDRAIKVIKQKYTELGPMSAHEIQVMILFILLVVLWFFKTPIFMRGWGGLFPTVPVASATPAILTCVLLFVLPQKYNFWPFADSKDTSKGFENSPSLITWRLIETKMCWGVLFLLGGGFALANALQDSGLSTLMVVGLTKLNLSSLPVWLASFIFSLVTVFITNIASNTATANVLVPILSKLALTMCVNPIYFTLPAGIACSYAFSLPVSTAPNAIVFSHSSLKTSQMLVAGLVMTLVATLVLVLAINTHGVLLFSLATFPEWARNGTSCV